MGGKRKELTQEEIWDDSALVDSWNEAYEEYKFYHSIHARGEKVKDVLAAYEDGQDDASMVNESKAQKVNGHANATPASEDGEIEDGEIEVDAEAHTDPETLPAKEAERGDATHSQNQQMDGVQTSNDVQAPIEGAPAGGSSMPDQLLAGTQDPALKNLMMSWYWAGYYSGFYEGQQQAKPSKTVITEDGHGNGK